MKNEYLRRLNISELKPMQEDALEFIKPGTDTVILAPTGSGKTLAFLLPIASFLHNEGSGVQSLVLLPTRELGLQIEKVFRAMQTGYKVNTCYGGHPIVTEINNFSVPPALLIGTPGRIADHISRSSFDPDTIRTLVLDEFDKSLELGFAEEMKFIIESCRNIKTRVLTSATNIEEIPAFVGLRTPKYINYQQSSDPKLTLKVLRAEGKDKLNLLFTLLCKISNESSVVFCNHREAVERISELLAEKGISHGIYHGGQEQEQREQSLIKFRNGSTRILLSTDLASRGLDIPGVQNIIHYQLPGSLSSWTHRNGRTARMTSEGTAWVLLAGEDYLPDFIPEKLGEETLEGSYDLPEPELFNTLYLSIGKKDKISKGDIAGFLMQKGMLGKDDLGLIEVLDYASFVAVKRTVTSHLLKRIKGEQLKKKKVKIELAR